jgi:hypothetical protein
MILQVGQEPSLLSLARRSAALSGKEIEVRVTPKSSKGSLGAAERAHSTIMGQSRSLLAAARSHYGNMQSMEDLLGPWSVRHAAWLQNRFLSHKPRVLSSYQLVFGDGWRGQLLVFGETCLVKSDPERLNSKFARWAKGVWVGSDDLSNSHLVLTPNGTGARRAVRRLPEGEQSQPTVLDEACGAPWSFLDDPRIDRRSARGRRERERAALQGKKSQQAERLEEQQPEREQQGQEPSASGQGVAGGVEPPPGLGPVGMPTLALSDLPGDSETAVKRQRAEGGDQAHTGPPNPSQRPEALAGAMTPTGQHTSDPRDHDMVLKQQQDQRPAEVVDDGPSRNAPR